MTRSAEIQKQYPPDWEEAERYGLSKMCSKSLQTTVDFNDESTFCLSNLEPIPTEEQRFSCCDDNDTFGKMGSIGFPLFFEFNK